ncbi:MAG: hypothetical protein AMXMBFR58_10680 [Phycisphaerae bacterium]
MSNEQFPGQRAEPRAPEMTEKDPRSHDDAVPSTPIDETRDLALSHLIERFADGEFRPEEFRRIEAEIGAMPGGPQRLAFERRLKAACARVMGDVSVDPGCKTRVMEAVRLRLRGEADALENQAALTQVAGRIGPAAARPQRTVRLRRFAAAAALVLAGFLCARLTGEYAGSRDFSGPSSAGLNLSRQILSADYDRAVQQAETFLGHGVRLPAGAGIVPVRFEPGGSDPDRRSVSFEYTVRIPNDEQPGRYRRMPVTVFVEIHSSSSRQGVVSEVHGDVTWWSRQMGELKYSIQSESEHAVAVVAKSMGWPSAGESAR